MIAISAVNQDRELKVAQGKVPNYTIINKFGTNDNVGTTMVPITRAGVFQTPTTAQSLEIVSSSSDDSSGGTGARTFYIQGLDENWNLQEEIVTMNGTTAVAIPGSWFRVFRGYVVDSGTYATSSAGSHAGTITVRGSGGGSTWMEVGLIAGFPAGQSQIGVYTIPAGKTGYLWVKHFTVSTVKAANIFLFQRINADDTTAPFGAMRLIEQNDGIAEPYNYQPKFPLVSLAEKTDVGFMAYVATGSGSVSVDFQIQLVDN